MKDLECLYDEIEQNFIKELYDNEANGYKIEKGNGKIMLSSPHSVSQIRNGKTKIGEYRTGLIVKEINRINNNSVIYKTKNLNDDANYDSKCKFKNRLLEYLNSNKDIKMIIDLHISSDKKEYDIDIGTGNGNNICHRQDVLELMVNKLKSIYTNTYVDNTFPASYKHTVSSTVSRILNIPSFQIEVNWKNINNYNKTELFISTIIEMVNDLDKII
jgi:hypothetical protein